MFANHDFLTQIIYGIYDVIAITVCKQQADTVTD